MYLFIPKNKEDVVKIEEQLKEKCLLGTKVIVDTEYKDKYSDYTIIENVYPNNPNKEALIIDCAEVIKNTQHPLQKFDFTKKKQDKNKMCKCGLKMKLINRRTEPRNEYEYSVISDYKCDCGVIDVVENIKIINLDVCDMCGDKFQSVGGLQMVKGEDSIKFELKCICGNTKPFREILMSKDELQEVKYNDAMSCGATWEDVKTILRAETKKAGYKWQWSDRALEILKQKASPQEAIDKIKMTLKSGRKLATVVYL